MRQHLSLVMLLLSLLCGCATQNLLHVDPKAIAPGLDSSFYYNPGWEYRVRRDDKLNISVWGQDDLSVGSVYGIYNSNEVYGKWLQVDIQGMVSLPKVGPMKVEGMTLPEIKTEVMTRMGQWLNKPIVDVKVLNKEITVLGEVRNPGVYGVDGDCNSLLGMIARAGGLEFYAQMKRVKVLRQEGENVRMATIDLSAQGDLLLQNIQLRPGDIVIVPSKGYKEFDKRISVIIPLTNTVTAAGIILGLF